MIRHLGIFFLSQRSLNLINPIMWTARCWCCTIFFVTFTFYNNQAICITYLNTELISVQFSHSVVSDSLWPHELQHARPPCPSRTPGVHANSCPSSRWCHPAISSSVVPFPSCPQSLPASVFSNESTPRVRWPKYWSFSFSISPSKEHPGLISFRMDWLDLLAVQGTLKSLLQHHSSKASVLQHSAFFTVQLSHPYMTTGKTIALIRWTFVGKVMSLLFNMLSRLGITVLPRNTELRCFQTFPKYSSQWRFYSVFWFLSISEPRNITPTGEPNFMKNIAARSPKAAASTCPTLGTGV